MIPHVKLPPFPQSAPADQDAGIEIDPRVLKEDLEECLSTIDPLGKFAVFETPESFPNPGIVLNKGGAIGLPLSRRDAEAVIEACHQAPFGKGEHMYVDVKVRKTWELSKDEFRITNGAWYPFLQDVVSKVSAGLGISSTGKDVTAELYKPLLYDEGAMFKPHQECVCIVHMLSTSINNT